MTELERLAVAQAAYKRLGEIVSTKDADSLRGRADAELLADFAANGTDRRRLMLNGAEVGKLSVAVSPAKTIQRLYVEDVKAFAEWLADGGIACFEAFMAKHGEKLLQYAADSMVVDGVVPDGCTAYEEKQPQALQTKITGCKPEDVAQALGEGLPPAFMGLLMGGENG